MLVRCDLTLVLITGVALCLADWPTPTTVVSVLDRLRLRYNWNCIYLLRWKLNVKDLNPDLALQILREATLSGLQMGTMEYKEFLKGKTRNYCKCKSEVLFVIIEEGKTKDFLKDVGERTRWQLAPSGTGIVLLFSKKDLFRTNFFNKVDIPFHGLFILAQRKGATIQLLEGYRIGTQCPMTSSLFGVWRNGRLKSTDKTLYDRRDDLKGFEIKAAFIEVPPFSPVETTPQGVRPSGLIGEIWSALAKQMNCSTKYLHLPPPDNSQFTLNNQLRKNKTAHVGLFTYVTTLWWLKHVQFSVPMFETSCFVYLRLPESLGPKWGNYLEPFSPRLWQTLLATVLVTTVAFVVLQAGAASHTSEMERWDLWSTLQLVFGAFSAQGHERTPESYSKRLAFFTTFVTAMVMTSAYSAKLISFLAVYEIEMPFSRPEDFIEDKSYSFGFTWANTESIIFKGTAGYWGEVFKRTRPENDSTDTTLLPKTTVEGLNRSCARRYGHMALHYDASLYEDVLPCRLATLPNFDVPVSLSLPFEKNSPYMGLVDHNLRKMRRSGILKRLVRKNWPEGRPADEKLLTRVELQTVRPILTFLCASIVMCATMLLAERLMYTVQRRRATHMKITSRPSRNTRRNKRETRPSQLNLLEPIMVAYR